ncbi:MAG: hypothetical protein ACYTBJ_16155 [Planctomycetota bacterium]
MRFDMQRADVLFFRQIHEISAWDHMPDWQGIPAQNTPTGYRKGA